LLRTVLELARAALGRCELHPQNLLSRPSEPDQPRVVEVVYRPFRGSADRNFKTSLSRSDPLESESRKLANAAHKAVFGMTLPDEAEIANALVETDDVWGSSGRARLLQWSARSLRADPCCCQRKRPGCTALYSRAQRFTDAPGDHRPRSVPGLRHERVPRRCRHAGMAEPRRLRLGRLLSPGALSPGRVVERQARHARGDGLGDGRRLCRPTDVGQDRTTQGAGSLAARRALPASSMRNRVESTPTTLSRAPQAKAFPRTPRSSSTSNI